MFKVYGIRHHGPGSTRSLLSALEAQDPDCLLIEAPQDAEGVLEYVLHPGLEPPVAILLYDKKDPRYASYLPFASFSPEWQAAQFGLAKGLELRFMDLPMSLQFKLDEREEEQLKIALPSAEQEPPAMRDPMGYIAKLAGYTDSERWWEATFEQPEHEIDIFDTILSLNTALRDELKRDERPMNRLREAFMRKTLRRAIKDGFKNIAVVCGAWHAPALHYLDRFTRKNDNALLKGKKKRQVAVTWIPWSYPRLAFQSGYRAGLVSPAYYELLFNKRDDTVQHWMARVANLLREEGIDASAAQAVDASQLARTLASLRQLPIAGIEEMREAVQSVFGHGSNTPMELIEQRLVIGQKVGQVPEDIPQIPLQEDLENRLKSARLKKYYQTGYADDKELDLRKPTHLDASHLLHQLRLLDVPWGRVLQQEQGRLGSFSETWHLHWQPEFIIRLIQAGMWGNTVYAAASQYVLKQAAETELLSELVGLAKEALLAGITEAFEPLTGRLGDAAAVTEDVYSLMQALPALTDIQRYGDTRQTDIESVSQLIQQLVPRIAIGLPPAVLHIEEEVARGWKEQIVQNNRAISLLNETEFHQLWNRSLKQVATAQLAHPTLQGLCCRFLYDKGEYNTSQTAQHMRFSLSSQQEAEQGALWLEGFLYGSGLLLLNLPELWQLLEEWITEMPDSVFQSTLPIIRRAFTDFSGPEREKMMRQVRFGAGKSALHDTTRPATAFDQQRARKVLPTVKRLLGMEEN
ncbi:MAG TPA: DUF5682 family protein [Phaeodactylibacter sp.]|nr:DUF5682 family protein [Phaeodactylibacter sp.]